MRLGYSTDWHLSDKVPVSRNPETFFKRQSEKLVKLLSIMAEEKVDFIINNGDVFDVFKPSIKFINEILDIINKFKIPMVINVGNHDIIGYNLQSYSETAIGILEEFKYIKIIHAPTTLTHEGVDLVFLPIVDQMAHTTSLYKSTQADDRPRICITHNSIVPVPALFKHLLCLDIATQCQSVNTMFLCGHIHTPFDFSVPDRNVRFLNPGCLMRTSISEKGVAPKAYIIEIEKEGWAVTPKLIGLSDEGEFLEKTLPLTKEFQLDGFFTGLSQYSWDGVNLEQHIQNLQVEPPVKDELLRRLKQYA